MALFLALVALFLVFAVIGIARGLFAILLLALKYWYVILAIVLIAHFIH